MRRLLFAVTTAAAFLFHAAADAQPLGIGTNPQGTLVYTLAATLSKALATSAMMQSRLQPQSGTGTTVPLVNSGELDIGFCNAREFYDSYYGVGSSNKRPNPNLRTMAVLFPLQVALLVRNDSPIKSTKDLKGKTIAYGYASQEVIRILLDGLLANAGLTVKRREDRAGAEPRARRRRADCRPCRRRILRARSGQGVGGRCRDLRRHPVSCRRRQPGRGRCDDEGRAGRLCGQDRRRRRTWWACKQAIPVAFYDYVAFANKDVRGRHA